MGRVFDCRKHSNAKRHASYRRIGGGRYYKSVEKAKAEKLRRQQIQKLQGQGCSVTRIAMLLGVSRRTVQRDLQKLQSYAQAKLNRLQLDDYVYYHSLSDADLGKAARRLREVIRQARLRAQIDELTVRVNVDAAFTDRLDRSVSFAPRLPVDFADWGEIAFELHAAGRVLEAARLSAVIPSKGKLILGTNLSKDPTLSSALMGLKIVDPADPKPAVNSAEIGQLAQIQRRMFRLQNPWRMPEFQNLKPQQQDQLLEQYNELCGHHNRIHEAKIFTITLNLDQAINAAYPTAFTPHLPVLLEDYSKINLKLRAYARTQHLITLQATDIEYGLVNLQKSERHCRPKFNSLKGLQITDRIGAAIEQTG